MDLAIEPSRARRGLWAIAALLGGALAMSLEIAAARLVAPALGSSIDVLGTLISVILGAMALGYAIGGRVADRARDDRVMFLAILGSGVHQVAALFFAAPVLSSLGAWSDFAATALAISTIFAPPVLLLAGVGPYVIRLSARGGAGAAAGRVYALGTAGSIAGVLGTTFALLPGLGTRATLQTLAGLSLLLGIAGLLPRRSAIAGLLFAVAIPYAPRRERPARTRWVGESVYHEVQVVQLGRLRGLVLDHERDLHTAIDPGGGRSGGYWDDFAVGPLLAGGHRVLVLGMGAGASIRAVRWADPDAIIDAVELDPLVVRVAAEQFGVTDGPGLAIHVADARRFVARDHGRYDVIQADLFRGGPEIPAHLVTVEFYALIRSHLARGGVFMLNVFDLAPGRALLRSVAATLARVFPAVLVRSREGNHLLLAFAEPRTAGEAQARLLAPVGSSTVTEIASEVAGALAPMAWAGGEVLTDDRAPIERLTRAMLSEARAARVLP